MRTIKFRGFNKKNNKWLYGYYLVNRGQHFVVEDNIAPVGNTWEDYEIDPDTLGQFTGLHDKNGKDIYEGDIVQLNEFVYEVGYDDKRFASFVLLRKQDMFKHYFGEALEANQVDIIGNIHDNPELLNTK